MAPNAEPQVPPDGPFTPNQPLVCCDEITKPESCKLIVEPGRDFNYYDEIIQSFLDDFRDPALPLNPVEFARGSNNLANAPYCLVLRTYAFPNSESSKEIPSLFKKQRFFIPAPSASDMGIPSKYLEITTKEARENLLRRFASIFFPDEVVGFECSAEHPEGCVYTYLLDYYRIRTLDDELPSAEVITEMQQDGPSHEDAFYYAEGEASESTTPVLFDPPKYVAVLHKHSTDALDQPPPGSKYLTATGFQQGKDGILRLPCAKDNPPHMVHWSLFSFKLDGEVYRTCDGHRPEKKETKKKKKKKGGR